MKNVGQIGFDFGDSAPAYRLDADWTWEPKRYTFSEYTKRIGTAETAMEKLTGIPQAVFGDMLVGLISEHARQVAHCGYDEETGEYRLWGSNVKFDAQESETIIEHCKQFDGKTVDGIEYKVRVYRSSWNTSDVVEAGMYYPGVGTVVIGRYKHSDEWHYSASFHLVDRDSHFLPHYNDDVVIEYCSEAVWAPAYSAQLIAEAHNKIPSVRTFRFGGREYVNTGASHGRNHFSQCTAWSITPATEWAGDTFSYADLTEAWSRGAAQRGDKRGLLVRVRGVLCVLEKPFLVYDDQPRQMIAATEEEDETDEMDELPEGMYEQEEDEEEELSFA
jgi:hypothetical protein